MRIEAYNKINEIYQTSKINKVEKKQAKGSYDKLEISSTGRDYQVAKNAVKQVSDVRIDRINEIKEAMASGTYNISMKEVADKLVDSYFDQKI